MFLFNFVKQYYFLIVKPLKVNIMKKLITLSLFGLMALFTYSQTFPLAIQMTTSKSQGEIISIDIAKYSVGNIQIDWGNGIKETFSISNIWKNIRGTVAVNNATIKIYGERFTYLDCSQNKLTSLSVVNNPDLTTLGCHVNAISEINLQSNVLLKSFSAYTNSLTAIDVSKNTKLERLILSINKLTYLSVKNNIYLDELYCDRNLIDACAWNDLYRSLPDRSSEAFKGNLYAGFPTSDTELKASYTKLATSLGWKVLESYTNGNAVNGDATGCYNATMLTTKDVNQPFSLSLASNPAGKVNINWGDANWETYDAGTAATVINGFTKSKNATIRIFSDNLSILDCSSNQVKEIDVSKSLNIAQLHCNSNELEGLNLANNNKLTVISCFGNLFNACGYDNLYRTLFDRSKNLQITGKIYIANTLSRIPGSITTSGTQIAKNLNWNTLNKANEILITGDGTGCTTALNEIYQTVSIYPNPVNDVLTILLPESKFNIKIFTTTGELLVDQPMETNKVNVSYLKCGFYILLVDTGNEVLTSKFFKK